MEKDKDSQDLAGNYTYRTIHLKASVIRSIVKKDKNNMDEKIIRQRVKDYYWQHDLNCTTVTLKILAEHYSLELADQVLDSAVAMHGAGKYGAQCGLVEGTLLFLGILGRARHIPDNEICSLCYRYAKGFEEHFTSLLCRKLRPEGFSSLLPPHLCEELTARAISFSATFLEELVPAFNKQHS